MKYNLSDANSTLELANELKKFIKENNLFLMVHGKPHINIEAWQYAAANLGIVPVVEKVENLSNDREIKYGAFVTCYQMETWQKVSAGYAVCSNTEPGKKGNPEFAICSMAQTRAEGKAYRLLLGWLIKAAGYEATPSEEMDSLGLDTNTVNNRQVPDKAPKQAQEGPKPNPTEGSHHSISNAPVALKNELIKLLNNKLITHEEKEAYLAKIGGFTPAQIEKKISTIMGVIADRQKETSKA